MNFDDALRYLDDHTSYDVTGRIDSPTTERIGRLCAAMGDPQHAAPVIHVTGTNGKGSTVQMISRLLMTSGLTVGTYTSPHLERINERIQRNGEPISDEEFAEQIAAIAQLEAITGVRPSFFEAITAAAFRWFAQTSCAFEEFHQVIKMSACLSKKKLPIKFLFSNNIIFLSWYM